MGKLFNQIFKKLGIKKTGKENNIVENLMKPPKRPKGLNIAHIDNFKKNSIHQADLLIMPSDRRFRYVLSVVDTSSRHAGAVPLKSKKPQEVLKAFKKLYRTHNHLETPTDELQVDPGGEFKGVVARYFKKRKVFVKVGRPGRHKQQAMAENLNYVLGRTLHAKMNAQELETGEVSTEWVDDLPLVMKTYNEYIASHKPKKRKELKQNEENLI